MNLRTLATIGLLGLCAASAAIYTPQAQARTFVSISVGVGPPPPRYEHIVVREGYVWAPGYWRWRHGRYVWVDGYWMRPRSGYVWVGPRWEPNGPHWRFHAGYWARH